MGRSKEHTEITAVMSSSVVTADICSTKVRQHLQSNFLLVLHESAYTVQCRTVQAGHWPLFSQTVKQTNGNSQHNNSDLVRTNRNYTYFFCQISKNVFFYMLQNLVISLCVLRGEKGWKPPHEGMIFNSGNTGIREKSEMGPGNGTFKHKPRNHIVIKFT